MKGQFTGDFSFDHWMFEPHVGVIYFEEKQKSYTDSLNIFIPSQTVPLGRLTFGPKISTTNTISNGAVLSPHIGLKGIWDFRAPSIVDINNGLSAVANEGLRGRTGQVVCRFTVKGFMTASAPAIFKRMAAA